MALTLEQRLAAAAETIDALQRRVEEKVASGESAFAVMEQSIALERLVALRTSQLERKQAELEEALRRNREVSQALALAQELAQTGDWVWNVATGEVSRSAEYCRILGLDPVASSATSEEELRFIHSDDRARVRDVLERALRERGEFEMEYRVVSADGKVRFVYARGRVLVEAGEQLKMAGTRQDITARKEMQERLSAAERMATLGTLAGGAAHEIMNPLAYATSNIQFVADHLEGGQAPPSSVSRDELVIALNDGISGLHRIRRVVDNLRAFSYGDKQPGPVDVRQAIELAIRMASSELHDRARLVKDLRPVFPVEGDVSRLGQVFLNLLVNAAQAIPGGRPDENEIRVLMRMRGAEHVVVEVQDTGCGIPPEIKSRVFDPFFTTRPVGSGMGLGLSICHGIVRGLGGEIDCESKVGVGSTFRVVLRATGDSFMQDAAGNRAPR